MNVTPVAVFNDLTVGRERRRFLVLDGENGEPDIITHDMPRRVELLYQVTSDLKALVGVLIDWFDADGVRVAPMVPDARLGNDWPPGTKLDELLLGPAEVSVAAHTDDGDPVRMPASKFLEKISVHKAFNEALKYVVEVDGPPGSGPSDRQLRALSTGGRLRRDEATEEKWRKAIRAYLLAEPGNRTSAVAQALRLYARVENPQAAARMQIARLKKKPLWAEVAAEMGVEP